MFKLLQNLFTKKSNGIQSVVNGSKNLWISIDERMPEEGEDRRSRMVMGKLANGDEMRVYRYNNGWCDRLGFAECGFPDCRVKEWRELTDGEKGE